MKFTTEYYAKIQAALRLEVAWNISGVDLAAVPFPKAQRLFYPTDDILETIYLCAVLIQPVTNLDLWRLVDVLYSQARDSGYQVVDAFLLDGADLYVEMGLPPEVERAVISKGGPKR